MEGFVAAVAARGGRALLAVCAVAALAAPATAQAADPNYPAGFREVPVLSGLTFPMDVDFSPDGRLFVAEKSGLIKVFSGPGDRTPTTFADLRNRIHNYWDRGLMSLALDPGFPESPHVYALYAADLPPGGSPPSWDDGCPDPPGPLDQGCVISGRLVRLEADGDTMTGDEQLLVNGWCQQFPSHSLGDLGFDSEGALYVTGGEGASWTYADRGQTGNPCGDPANEGGALRSQDLRTRDDPTGVSGAVLRISPQTGEGWPSNPFFLDPDPNARRIAAHGLRNPFRFTFRPGTDELWIGDVGMESADEINRLPAYSMGVLNFGWPCYEGPAKQPLFDDLDLEICENLYETGAARAPIFSYAWNGHVAPNDDDCYYGGASISGLAFYSGEGYPGYDGVLFAADYVRQCIWTMRPDAEGDPDPTDTAIFATGINGPVGLEIGPGGDLYYVDFDGGAIVRVRHTGDNEPPIAVAGGAPTTGLPPLVVTFDGTESWDPDAADPVTYAWDFEDDGSFDSGEAEPSHEYATRGTYTARLRVTDSLGETDEDTVVVYAGTSPPDASIDGPPPNELWRVGDTIRFRGSARDVEDGPALLPPERLSWKIYINHCHTPDSCHLHLIQEFPGIASGTFVAPDHAYPSSLLLEVTATDSDGLQNSDSRELFPLTVNLSFGTSPPNLDLVVGERGPTPFDRTFIVGGTVGVSAPSPQGDWLFSSWSNGGPRSHEFQAPETAAPYTATFTRAPAPPPQPPPPPPPPPPAPQLPAPQPLPPPQVVRCVVPGLVGRTLTTARRRLARAHCRLGQVTRVYAALPAGRIKAQRPRPRTRLPKGAKVALVVSRGRRR